MYTRFWWKNLKVGIPRYDKRLILKRIIEKWDGRVQAGSSGSG
jgi:hypothetical protein